MNKNLLITVLTIAVAILIFLQFKQCRNLTVANDRIAETENVRKTGKRIDETNPAKINTASDGTTLANKKAVSSYSIDNTLNPKTTAYIKDYLMPELKASEKELKEFDKVKAVLSGEVPATTIQVSENKAVKIQYKNKYLSIVTELDKDGKPIPAQYVYNAEIVRAKIKPEKKIYLFGEKEEVETTWTSTDPQFRIDSVQSFIAKENVIKNGFILRAKLGGLISENSQQGKASVEALFNPDGFFFPSVEVGKLINIQNGNSTWFGAVNANFNLVKIKKNN